MTKTTGGHASTKWKTSETYLDQINTMTSSDRTNPTVNTVLIQSVTGLVKVQEVNTVMQDGFSFSLLFTFFVDETTICIIFRKGVDTNKAQPSKQIDQPWGDANSLSFRLTRRDVNHLLIAGLVYARMRICECLWAQVRINFWILWTVFLRDWKKVMSLQISSQFNFPKLPSCGSWETMIYNSGENFVLYKNHPTLWELPVYFLRRISLPNFSVGISPSAGFVLLGMEFTLGSFDVTLEKLSVESFFPLTSRYRWMETNRIIHNFLRCFTACTRTFLAELSF